MRQKNTDKKGSKIKITFKESLFLKSLNLAKSNPSKTWLMVLFDALFLIAVFGLQNLAQYFAEYLALPKTLASAVAFMVFSLIYYLAILFVYSFFKYSILDFARSLFEKRDFSFKRLGEFYALNIVIAGIFFAIMLFFEYILDSIREDYRPFVFIFMAIPYLLFLYIITNTSHSLFYEGLPMKDALKKSFKITFTKIKAYREAILAMILCALFLWILLAGSGYVIRAFASKNYSMYLQVYAYFKKASIIIFDAFFYFIIFINRISFYAIAREENKNKE